MKIMSKSFVAKAAIVLSATLLAVGLVACDTQDQPEDTAAETETTVTTDAATEATANDAATEAVTEATVTTDATTDAATDAETEATATTDAATEAPTEAATEAVTEAPSIKDVLGLDVKKSDLSEAMQSLFEGKTSTRETVMFLDKGDVKDLLYPITDIISVTSYDGSKTYVEGTDYEVVNGRLKVLAGSSIPCITSARYYNNPGSLLVTKDPSGNNVETFWGESQMKAWQVCVTYTHEKVWEGYTQESHLDVYQNFVKKLQNGEDVTVFFYGDSITWGACSSFQENANPKQGSYAMLFVQALADLFDYTVKYVNTGLSDTMACASVPTQDYVAGTRGTITYVNTAIGGWTTQNGIDKFDKMFKAPAQQYGCDLAVIAFGMNDAADAPNTLSRKVDSLIDKVHTVSADACVLVVATMVPNPNATNGWYGQQYRQESALLKMAKTFRDDGKPCAVACVTSVSQAILERKDFQDCTGNNINHPNDYFYRMYAQTLLQTLIGYENMN